MKRVLCAMNYRSLKEIRAMIAFGVKLGWLIDAPMASETLSMLRSWRGDGILTDFPGFVRPPDPGVRVVSLIDSKDADCSVIPDNREIGRCAAAFFLKRGYRNFALCSDHGDRGDAFLQCLNESGFQAAELNLDDFCGKTSPVLTRLLHDLGRPCAIFCQNDLYAVRMTFVLRESGFRIPEDFAVLGVGNEELYCESSCPPLSSVNTCLYERGLRAAEELKKRMEEGPSSGPSRIVFPPRDVIERGSTDFFAVKNPLLREMIHYIQEHLTEPLSIALLAKRFLRTESAVYRIFCRELHCSPKVFLTERRLSRARELLLSGDLKVSAVASECGFPDPNAFHRAFRACCGRSPHVWRMENRNIAGGASPFPEKTVCRYLNA